MSELILTEADKEVSECLSAKQSFAMIAGAGSGKTTSLITALKHIRREFGAELRKNSQRIACITYTNRAVEVISLRLGHDDLYLVSTLHSFLWSEIKRFSHDIRESIREYRIPRLIEKAREEDNGGSSKIAQKAREKILLLERDLLELDSVHTFTYDDSIFSDYKGGHLSHDDVIEVASHLLVSKVGFRKAIGYRFPYIFIDEAQDTFESIVTGFNLVGGEEGLPLVGYFGDPWQQIYDKRAGDFSPPENGKTITKTENFRSSESVIAFLNAFRKDVEQYPAGENKGERGSVLLTLIHAEIPEAPKGRYSEAQLERAHQRLDKQLTEWSWSGRNDIIKLFLVRQMIARKLGFSVLHKLFTDKFASARAKDDYESGEHFLLKPFLKTIWPLVEAYRSNNSRLVIELLLRESPAFDIHGKNSEQSLAEMIQFSKKVVSDINERWNSGTTSDILNYCHENEIVRFSEQLVGHLTRKPREEQYDASVHEEEKSDWLCDEFFSMGTAEIQAYCDFIRENTMYSTQHGVKGEQYPNVLVVFDDVEAAWRNYSFTKLLTPETSGQPTDGQLERSRKLAYVCFSRAEIDLRIVLFTPDPEDAKQELIRRQLLSADCIVIAE